MRICWDVLKEDIFSTAHKLGEAIVLALAGLAVVVVFLAPGVVLQPYLEFMWIAEMSYAGQVFVNAVLAWCVGMPVFCVLHEVFVLVVDRYTDHWSECGEHGLQDVDAGGQG